MHQQQGWFYSGEGAGAIVFCKPDSCIQGIYITGVGVSNEDAHILQNDKANMARGLSVAIRKSIHDAGILLAETDFHISGVTGESWYFRETALAITRCLEKKKAISSLPTCQQSGRNRAASGPLTLAYLNEMMCRFLIREKEHWFISVVTVDFGLRWLQSITEDKNMDTRVYINNREACSKASDGVSKAAFPDPCWTPPSPPAGPIVVPYPNTAYASALKDGTTTIFVCNSMVAKENISYFSTSTGDEGATQTQPKV